MSRKKVNSIEIEEINKKIVKENIKILKVFDLNEEFLSFLKYGKRLRVKLLLAANNIKEKKTRRRIATLIELLHTASLIHDDVIDGNRLRRSLPTVNYTFNNKFAIAVGYIFFSNIFLNLINLKKEFYLPFFETIKDMCIGEILEINSAFDKKRTEKNYIETIRLKTGSLFILSCSIGSNKTDLSLKKFGENYGIAFQILDDIEDLISDESESGKPRFQDLNEGIYTLPVIYELSNNEKKKGNLFSKETILLSKRIALNYIEKAKEDIRNKELLNELEQLRRRIMSVFSP